MSELKAFRIIQGDTGGYGAPSYKCDTDGNRLEEWCDICEVYDKSEADKVIADLKAERDEYRYNLSCARNEIHNMQAPMRDDIKTIAELKADYKEACDRLQTANLIKDEQLAATRHQKYKRCLAMAMRCGDACDKWMMKKSFSIGLGKDGVEYYHQARRKLWFYMRWHKRWLELAEKFKEAK